MLSSHMFGFRRQSRRANSAMLHRLWSSNGDEGLQGGLHTVLPDTLAFTSGNPPDGPIALLQGPTTT